MLIQFNFSNYRSFKDEVSLDLTASKITEHAENVVKVSNDKVLRVAAIYGANASGKSNIYNAFEFMTQYVIHSFNFGGDDNCEEGEGLEVEPFKFDKKSQKEPTIFEVFFTDSKEKSERTYQYGFSIKESEIEEEWLFYKAKSSKNYNTIFYRKKGKPIDFSGIKTGAANIEVSLEKETLIVSLGSKLKINKLKKIRDWFLRNEIVNFGDPIENLFLSRTLPMKFVDDKSVQQDVVNYFSTFDTSIKDFSVEEKTEVANKKKEKNKMIKISSLHKVIGEDDIYEELDFRAESSGTLKMFSLYPPIKNVLENGGVLFIDELNGKLHPLLIRSIILTFENKDININNAQLVFTTHDIWQLSNDLLRRDEIWFVEKTEEGISELYSLVEFVDSNGEKIRKDEFYIKNYLQGKYGAIPKLKTIDILKVGEKNKLGEEKYGDF
ncbi:MAG: AAA family ATPase [Proteocatella sp.]